MSFNYGIVELAPPAPGAMHHSQQPPYESISATLQKGREVTQTQINECLQMWGGVPRNLAVRIEAAGADRKRLLAQQQQEEEEYQALLRAETKQQT
jgi:hypothetical protein